MREQSQLDDMRAALRGDLERAKARREAEPAEPAAEAPSEPLPLPTTQAKVVLTPARPTEPEPEAESDLPFAPEPEEPVQSPKPEVSETPTPVVPEEPEPKPGFFLRLFR